MKYHLTAKSDNVKTGAIPVSTTSKESCPSSCPLINAGCYAKTGPLGMHWSKVTTGSNPNTIDIEGLAYKVRAFPENQLWRHNQAGDLPGYGEHINPSELDSLIQANKGRRGFTYTHKKPTGINAELIRRSNAEGFTVNLSANNLAQADEYKALNIAPVVVIVPEDAPRKLTTPAGNTVVICPAQQKENVTCASCGLCQVQKRVIIGFRAHGTQKKTVNTIVKG